MEKKKKGEIQYFTMDPKLEYVKIFGLQRSGTNYISHLLNENFESVKALINVGGWKHGYYSVPWIMGKELSILGVTKSPYAWLVSMYNYWGPNRKLNIGPDLRGVSFEHFVRNKVIFEKQRDIPFLIRSVNPVQHWNNMNFHWLSIRLNSKKLCFVTYEMILSELDNTLTGIETSLGLKKKKETKTTTKTLLPSGEEMKTSDENFEQREYYLKGGFMKYYTPELLEFVNGEIDLDLMVHFGYNMFSVKDLERIQKGFGE